MLSYSKFISYYITTLAQKFRAASFVSRKCYRNNFLVVFNLGTGFVCIKNECDKEVICLVLRLN